MSIPGKSTPDVSSENIVAEVKQRYALPQWLLKAVRQAHEHARSDQLPIVVLHEKGRHNSIVIMSLKDFVDWHGEFKTKPEKEGTSCLSSEGTTRNS